MASGWWKSSHDNLVLVSPADFTVTTAPVAPRNWGKISSVVASGGIYMGGTPCITIDDVIYYAGDDYTQGTDNPPLCRYDGRVSTTVLELPFITGSTPSKAILSLAADDDGRLFISTWDSGTTSSDFVGRVYIYTNNTLTRVDGSLFTGGKLPYTMAWFNNALYVGVSKQDPSSTTEVIRLPIDDGLPGGPASLTATLTGTTYSYRVGALDGPPDTGHFIYKSNTVAVTNRSSLNASFYNFLDWDNPGGLTSSYRVERAGDVIADVAGAAPVPTEYTDYGPDNSAGAGMAGTEPQAITLTVTTTPAQATTYTYYVTAVIDGFEFLSSSATATGPATLYSDLYMALSWSSVSGATAYNVYRTTGGGSTGLISTTASTSLNDTGLTGNGVLVPTAYSSIALTSGCVTSMVVYNSNLYVGSAQPAATFGKVFKITSSDTLTTSRTAAPGGSAAAYNGYTAGFVFNSNLYMGYWNDDATDICLIEKFDDAAWSTVKTISGAGARPWVGFIEADSTAYAYGGGDGQTGILYDSSTGASWTDQSALLPSSREAIPFMANANILGGF